MIEELESSSPEETERVAARLAEWLRPGDVVGVSGELGAGKTTFVRGACRALGVTVAVTSPTYTVGHRYEGRVPVSHLDLFRIEQVGEDEWGNLEPYFDGAIVFVEWPEHAPVGLLRPSVAIRLGHRGGDRRSVRVDTAP